MMDALTLGPAANDNRVEQYDIDAMGRIYELRPDGSRGRLVAAFVTWSSAARELMRLNGRP